jgi:hypothetical protein
MRTMKSKTILLPLALCLSAQCVTLLGDVPKPQPLSRYTSLWTKSRVCSKPEVIGVDSGPPVFEDYDLLSVTPMGEEYMVSIRNKKEKTGGRVRILPGQTNSEGFKVLGVEQTSDYMETKVKLSHKGKTGIVKYDEKFLKTKKPSVAAKPKPKAKPRIGGRPPVPGRKPTTSSNNNLPPGLKAAGITNANAGRTSNPNAAGAKASTRKPRVRRVPTPPTR